MNGASCFHLNHRPPLSLGVRANRVFDVVVVCVARNKLLSASGVFVIGVCDDCAVARVSVVVVVVFLRSRSPWVTTLCRVRCFLIRSLCYVNDTNCVCFLRLDHRCVCVRAMLSKRIQVRENKK